jgi:hypothetical protein
MQLMLVGGVLLLIDSFLHWQSFSASIGTVSVSAHRNAWHGWGVLAGLLTILLLVWLAARLAATDLRLPVSDTMVGAALGTLIVLFTLIKVLADNEFRTIWAWIGLVLAALVALGAWLEVTAGGGMATLRTEASGMRTGAGGTGAGTTAPPPPPEAPSEPPPPPPAG